LDDCDFAASLATANTLIFLAVFFDPHSGHAGLGPSAMVR
jgi:hypothetical protein